MCRAALFLKFNSLTGLAYQPYHPLSVERNSWGKTMVCCCSFHTLDRESGEKSLWGSAVQNTSLLVPPCCLPRPTPGLRTCALKVDLSSDVLGFSFPSRLFSFNLLPFSLNQFPSILWFASGFFSYWPELLEFTLWKTKQNNLFCSFSGTWKGRGGRHERLVYFSSWDQGQGLTWQNHALEIGLCQETEGRRRNWVWEAG